MKTHVRPATSNDASVLTELALRSKQSNGYDDDFMAACRDELTVSAQDIENHEYWIAQSDRVVGCACLVINDNEREGEVHAFFVDPASQGKGIGRQLWAKLEHQARNKGIEKLILDADPNAVVFYEKLGFAITSQSPSGSIPGRMLPQMTKFLKQ